MKCFVIAIALALSVSTIGSVKQESGALPNDAQSRKLDALINHPTDAQGTLAFALSDILRDTSIPSGVVQVLPSCSSQSELHLKMELGRTIRQALDALVAADPQYQWTLKDGLVIITPRSGVPAFLTTKIHSFKWRGTDNAVPSVPMNELVQLSEIRSRYWEFGVSPAIMQGLGMTAVELHPVPRRPLPIEIKLKNLSLMDAFSAIIRAYGHGMWVYTEYGCIEDGARRFIIDSSPD